ncbi:MAG: PilZ domain protein [Candidatus Omnitrophica bacterium ADurb.Bin205]|nr:MAG: PilZ domain protein [Candidatus Omnitrophica bacterium ADurb.Bin205]
MGKQKYLSEEQRKYVRLDTVFPVQIQLVSLEGNKLLSGWLQGFTNNVSRGGLCLSIGNLDENLAEIIKKRQVMISLEMELPFIPKPISSRARIVWVQNAGGIKDKYLIGLCYEDMDKKYINKIMRYAWGRKILIPLGIGLVVIFSLLLGVNGLINFKLTQANKELVRKLVSVIQEASVAKEEVIRIQGEAEELHKNIENLISQINSAEEEKLRLSEKERVSSQEYLKKLDSLNSLIQKLSQEKGLLEETLSLARARESIAKEELSRLDKIKLTLEKANVDKMYRWVKVHQNPRTGLVISFEGDSDIKGWSFIYDQSLAAQAYMYYSDLGSAQKILDFFLYQAKKEEGLFFNAYYALDGEVSEYILHSGPNIWIGIAVAQYIHRTSDFKYLTLAEGIANAIIRLQKQDKEGGIRGGPLVTWYSTEHNLDAYAFLNMLYEITGNKKYADSRDLVLSWLIKHAYDKVDVPIKRGRGDSTIATDTYAWSIAAIGPDKLRALGMDPDGIMNFAVANCAVEVEYLRPEGNRVKVKGFDFAPQKHVARGGVVSSEWTAQMVISFRIMEGFYSKRGNLKRAGEYGAKARDYLSSLGNMIISSPSPSGQGESCLPYATLEFVDTGHGWFTPKGKSTGSLAGTTYTILAYYNYNPLAFKD